MAAFAWEVSWAAYAAPALEFSLGGVTLGSLLRLSTAADPTSIAPAVIVRGLAAIMLVCALPVFWALAIAKIPYGYGKHAWAGLGIPIPARIAWIVQELPSLLLPLALWYLAARDGDAETRAVLTSISPNTVLLSMMIFHYLNRAVIYPLRIKPGAKPTPGEIAAMAFLFCLWNGYMQGRNLTVVTTFAQDAMYEPNFVIGVLLWFIGLVINWQADDILINLRKPGETGYKIPMGGMFYYVSGANFFGEIVEWAGFALAAWSLPALAFAVFTFCNIGPRGAQHHEWLKSKFKEYPRARRAVIPFLW